MSEPGPACTTHVTFLPHRLNRQPVVLRGAMTADEAVGLRGALRHGGLAACISAACWRPTLAMVATLIVGGYRHLGVFVGAARLRRTRRGPSRYLALRHLRGGSALRHPRPRARTRAAGRWSRGRATGRARRSAHEPRSKNEITATLQAHIKTLRLGAGALFVVAFGAGLRLVECASRSDHPRANRPALGIVPQVGEVPRSRSRLHLRVFQQLQPLGPTTARDD